jgi:glutamine amidotransferase of anthranilate synthase or aminodeoxychorismate synthase
MKILIIDNYDSFTYNLARLIIESGFPNVDIFRNDKITLEEVNKYDKIILSPGPGLPEEAGILLSLIKHFRKSKSILGICLGHQAIAQAFRGKLINMEIVHHGVESQIEIISGDYLFSNLPRKIEVGRYHSWVIDKSYLPNELKITALDKEGEIMAIKHRHYDIHGLQFHPESIMTPYGKEIINQFLNN